MPEIVIPPATQVREKLAAATAEARYLRRLLRLARERDESIRLASQARPKRKGRR